MAARDHSWFLRALLRMCDKTRMPFRFGPADTGLWWVLFSLASISLIADHPYAALTLAILGGSLIGFATAFDSNLQSPIRHSRLLWMEPAIVVFLSPLFLFPTPKRSMFFAGLILLLLVHFVVTRRVAEPTPVLLPLVLLLLMVSVSLYATHDMSQSLPKVAGVILGAAAMIALVNSVRTESHLSGVTIVFLMGGVVLAGVGLLGTQWIVKVPILAKFTSHLPHVIRGLQGAEEGFQPNGVAGGLILIIPLQVALTYCLLRERATGKIPTRLFLPLLISLMITTGVVILTQSRGGWLGLAVGVLLWVFWSSRRGRWFVGMICILGTAAVLWLGPRAIGDRIMSGIGGNGGVGSSMDGRLEVWNRAVYGISDFPFTGMGMNTFRKTVRVLYPLFLTSPDMDIAHCHNQLLQTALDLGLPGLVAYVAMLAAGITMGILVWRRSRQAWIRCCAQGLVCGLIAQQVFGITDAIALGAKIGIFFWIALGMLAAMHRVTAASASARGSRTP